MKLRGEDVASSVRDWLKDDIKNGPSSKHELGKFFLGVSTGTLGLFATLLKFAVASPSLDCLTVGCFLTLLLSTVVAVYMAVPTIVQINTNIELYAAYSKSIRSIKLLMALWFGLWLVGFCMGTVKLFV